MDQNFRRSWVGWSISEAVGKMLAWAVTWSRGLAGAVASDPTFGSSAGMLVTVADGLSSWLYGCLHRAMWLSSQFRGWPPLEGVTRWPRRAKWRLQCHGWLAIDSAPCCLHKTIIHPHGLSSVEAGHVDARKQVDMVSPLYTNKLHSESVFVRMICL